MSGLAAAVWTVLEHQTGVIRHHGDEIDHVLKVEEEGSFGRTGGQSDDELDGKPGVADGLGDEERVEAGAARWEEPRHCLHTEHDDQTERERQRNRQTE